MNGARRDEKRTGSSRPTSPEAPAGPPPSARVPRAFLIAVFAAAILLGAAIAYYGITGHLGSGIP